MSYYSVSRNLYRLCKIISKKIYYYFFFLLDTWKKNIQNVTDTVAKRV